MKIDSNVYREAHKLAVMPRMKMLFYGIVCGATVPAMYLRTYYLPQIRAEDAENIQTLENQVTQLEQRTKGMDPIMRISTRTESKKKKAEPFSESTTKTSENLGAMGGVGEIPIASWHIGGRNRFANDEKYRQLVEEANAIMFSSIM